MINPTIRSLFICDRFIRYTTGKADLLGIFNRAKADAYPHLRIQIVAFCELVNGMGDVPFRFEIVNGDSGELVFATPQRGLRFRDRLEVVQLAHAIQLVTFDAPGVYFVQLWCNNEFVADARLEME